MGAVQSLVLSSEGAAAATTLVVAGAVGYRISRMTKPQEDESREKGEGIMEENTDGNQPSPDPGKARKRKNKKRATGAQVPETSTSDATGATTSAQVVPGGFDVSVAPPVPAKDTSKSKSKGKTKQVPVASGRTGTSVHTGDGIDDDVSSATPSEAPPPPAASASGSKSKKSKKRRKSAIGASSSASILTLTNASSSKATLSASNSGVVESSAVLVSNPGTTGPATRAEDTPHGSKSKKPLHSGDASTTEDNEDDVKPFLASLSSSRQQTTGQSLTTLIPPITMQPGAYPDTDSSWTHVRRGHHIPRDNSSSGLGQFSTSDAGVVSSVTDDGYPSSSPVAERAEDTEEDEAEAQAQDLGLESSYARATGDNTQRKTLAERLLPKPRKTGVEDMLETPDHPTLSRVVRVRPLPGERPVTGYSWADYEDVHVDEGAGHDADGEDDGWGVVRSRRSRPDYTSLTGATSSADASRATQGKSSAASNKKQRQHAKKREAAKAAKAEAEADRQATLAKHRQQLERERMMEQLSRGGSKAPSGGMQAAVDDNGKLVWE